jgi:PPK2 family polyphosphate:nucleotide phosphotransferase
MAKAVSDRWRIAHGKRLRLGDLDTRSNAGAPGDKAVTRSAVTGLIHEIAELQERLWAEQRQALLLVLQAMDAGGKDGAIEHVFTGVNPQGFRISNFRGPTEEELSHDFLWRVHRLTPRRGEIGIFNRSHYEDVVAVRVRKLAPEDVWRPRYELIRNFEALLASAGTTVVKCFLHISKQEQAERLRARLDDPNKRWKFRRGDLADRALWDDFMAAYEEAISQTTTRPAPWYVIPADRKWYRDWALANIVRDTLGRMDPQFPPPEEDLDDVVIE